mmetsp:Transcript_26/g.33  ORF Transcript_26/g.33 Transcript_26/m.33 type:complete len:122 (+) Transcript_26:3-368(+)
MNYVLVYKYSFITLIFVPLFIFIVVRMKQTLPKEAYDEIKCKTITLFSIYLFLLLYRLVFYIILVFFPQVLAKMQSDSELPLYCSEIATAVIIIYMLVNSSFAGDSEDNIENEKQKPLKEE